MFHHSQGFGHTAERDAVLRGSNMLARLPEEIARKVMSGARVSRFSRKSTIFMQGDPGRALYVVVDGWVKVYRVAGNGAEAVIGVISSGSGLNDIVAPGQAHATAAEAVTDCAVMRIDLARLFREIEAMPELVSAFMTAAFSQAQSLVLQLEALKAQSGAQRVASFLLDLAPCPSGPCTVELPYDKGLLAGRLGMKPESLSRAFARLREYGVEVRQNTVKIADIGRLQAFALSDPAEAWSRSA